MKKQRLGSNFDSFLEEEGLREHATAVAAKRVIAFQLAEAMSAKGITKSEMARRMGTSRAALERLLDPENSSVTLLTLQSAARAVGGKLDIRLASVDPAQLRADLDHLLDPPL
jgi:DNA-binding Xre family transcriptional regulator